MRIEKIEIKKFGPLKNFSHRFGEIDVFYGENEKGKTALVDALSETLFRGRRVVFPQQKRFEEKMEGEVLISEKDKIYTFPGKNKFEEIFGLPDLRLAGLFIVRSAELEFKAYASWWENVKEFLAGTGKVSWLIKNIFSRVGLTEKGEWSNSEKLGRTKSWIEERERRKRELGELRETFAEMAKEEEKLQEKEREKKKIEERVSFLKKLKQYGLWLRCNQAFEEWKKFNSLFSSCRVFGEEEEKEWEEIVREREREEEKKKKIEEIKEKLEEREKNLLREKKELEKEREKLQRLLDRGKLSGLEEKAYRVKEEKERREKKKNLLSSFLPLGWVLLVGGGIVLIITLLKGGTFLPFLGGAGLAGGGTFVFFLYYSQKVKIQTLEREEKKLLKQAREVLERCNSLDSLLESFETTRGRVIKIESRLQMLEEGIEEERGSREEEEEKLKETKKKLSWLEEREGALRKKTGLLSREELKVKLEEKRGWEKEKRAREEFLSRTLETPEPFLWKEKIKELKPQVDTFLEGRWGEEREEELKLKEEELERIKEEINSLKRNLSWRKGKVEASGVKSEVELLEELEEIEKNLQEKKREREAAFLVKEILEKLTREVDKELAEVIEKEEGVSGYFRRITGDMYLKVEWEDKNIKVYHREGKIYRVEALSSGTRDQLFLALRMGILKKKFPEGSFLILDDAFLTSDYGRRRRLVEIMYELSREGWQIIYLTVDKHLKNLFEEICKVRARVLQ